MPDKADANQNMMLLSPEYKNSRTMPTISTNRNTKPKPKSSPSLKRLLDSPTKSTRSQPKSTTTTPKSLNSPRTSTSFATNSPSSRESSMMLTMSETLPTKPLESPSRTSMLQLPDTTARRKSKKMPLTISNSPELKRMKPTEL